MLTLYSIHKRLLSLVLCFMLIIPYQLSATAPADYDGHWAEDSIRLLIEKGFATGYPDGSFKPEAQIKRAEFMAIVNSAFGFNEKTAVAFKDVKEEDWYYEHVSMAVKAGYIKGFSDGTMRPENSITRQEAAVILSRILGIEENTGTDILATVRDTQMLQEWSIKGVAAVVSKGYMNLRKDLSFEGNMPLTRAEMAAAVQRSYLKHEKKLYTEAGTYSLGIVDGSIRIENKDITLKDTVINGDLILGKGIGEGNVYLINVVVKGDTHMLGGGENSIVVENCSFAKIIIIKENNKIRVLAKGNTNIDNVELQSGAVLESEGLTGEGFGYVTIAEGLDGDALVELIGSFDSVEIRADGVQVQTSGGTIGSMTVSGTATGVEIQMSGDSRVTTLVTNAAATITGTGRIVNAQINTSGTTIQAPVTNLQPADGVTVSTGTGATAGGSAGGSGGSGDNNNDDNDDDSSDVAVSAITSADVGITQGSVVFGYTFSGTGGAITYSQALDSPYYLNTGSSTVTLTDGTNISAANVSELGISDDGTVSYENLAAVQAKFTELDFIPDQVMLHLVGATSVNSGSDAWTYDITIDLEANETALLTPPQTSPVTADPASGSSVASGALVSLASASAGAAIFYTTDGSAPTPAMVPTPPTMLYNSPIELTADTTIKAIAVKTGILPSDTSTFNYTIADGTDVTLQDPIVASQDEIIICIWRTIDTVDSPIPSLTAADFILIKGFGTPGQETVSGISLGTDPLGGTYEYTIEPEGGTTFAAGNYRLAFNKTGYDVAHIDFTISSIIPVSSITVSGEGSVTEAVYGEALQMIAAILPVDATESSITWSVIPGSGTAEIDSSSGLLTGTALGTVTVVATANDSSGVSGDTVITVVGPTISTTSVIYVGDVNPSIVIELVNGTFTDAAETGINWNGSLAGTGLGGGLITLNGDKTQITFNFTGTATGGTLTAQATAICITSGIETNMITVPVQPAPGP